MSSATAEAARIREIFMGGWTEPADDLFTAPGNPARGPRASQPREGRARLHRPREGNHAGETRSWEGARRRVRGDGGARWLREEVRLRSPAAASGAHARLADQRLRVLPRSEERRVGKECRPRCERYA